MSTVSPSSVLVAYAHGIFCLSNDRQKSVDPHGLDSQTLECIRNFKDKLQLWAYCHQIMRIKRDHDLDRSYLEVREGLIQRLIKMRKNQREEIDAQTRQLDHIADVIRGLEERRFHYAHELERYKNRDLDVQEESLERLELRLKEFDEELYFRQNVLTVQMELSQSRFPHITQLEEELEQLEKTKNLLEQECEKIAADMDLEKGLGKTLFFYMLNDGYFSYITDDHWGQMIFQCSSKEQTWLKEHFSCDVSKNAWILNDEQHYYSPLKRKIIVGSRNSSGISFLDYNIKKLLDEKCSHMTFTRYQDEVRSFYAFLCYEALEDGLLTREEAKMMDDLAKVLFLDAHQARQLLNQEAVRIQKEFINKNMAIFYDLAMADGQMHREEARFLVEMKLRMEKDIIENVVAMVQRVGEEGLRLGMDDESFFVELCRLALKDKHLDLKEQDILRSFVKCKGWPDTRLGELLAKAQ